MSDAVIPGSDAIILESDVVQCGNQGYPMVSAQLNLHNMFKRLYLQQYDQIHVQSSGT